MTLSVRPHARMINQDRRGTDNALSWGIRMANTRLQLLDADGSTDPPEMLLFTDAAPSGCDFAEGTRLAAGGGSEDITRGRRLGNRTDSSAHPDVVNPAPKSAGDCRYPTTACQLHRRYLATARQLSSIEPRRPAAFTLLFDASANRRRDG